MLRSEKDTSINELRAHTAMLRRDPAAPLQITELVGNGENSNLKEILTKEGLLSSELDTENTKKYLRELASRFDITLPLLTPELVDSCLGEAFVALTESKSRVIPIQIVDSDWRNTELVSRQQLPRDKEVRKYSNLDEAWAGIARELRLLINFIKKEREGETKKEDGESAYRFRTDLKSRK